MAEDVKITGIDEQVLQRIVRALEKTSSTTKSKIGGGTENTKGSTQATAKQVDKLGEAADDLTHRFGKMSRAIGLVNGGFGKMIGQMKSSGAITASATKPVTQASQQLGNNLGNVGNAAAQLGSSFLGTLASAVSLGAGLHQLKDAVLDVVTDIFRLQAGGVSAANNLVDFYIQAARAGMSLEEYTKLLKENEVAVTRFSSFKSFNAALESTTNSLATLGVFGQSARNLSAVMMSSATTLGIPQEKLGNVMNSQIAVFDQLRKTTLITAGEFQTLVQDLSRNEEVQKNLLGLNQAQRQARLAELMQIQTLGQRLGLTAQQAKALADAMLAQRKATAKERFEARGVIQQAGAIVGMNASETQELARLALLKNPMGADAERYRQLAAEFQQRMQAIQNSEDLASQDIIDTLDSQIPGFFKRISEEAGKAQLTVESGRPQNQDFGAQVGEFGKWVGNFATAVQGFMKNPIGEFIASLGPVLTGIASFFLSKKIGALLGGARAPAVAGGAAAAGGRGALGLATSPLQAMGNMASAPVGSLAGIGQAVGKATRGIVDGFQFLLSNAKGLGSGAVGVAKTLGSTAKAGIDYVRTFAAIAKDGGLTAAELAMQEGKAALSAGGKLITNGIGGVISATEAAGNFFKRIFGPQLGFIFGAVEEAFTGEIQKALSLGDGIFGKILGITLAGFRGIVTTVTELIDGAINWVLEGLGFDIRSNITHYFDQIYDSMIAGWKMIIMGVQNFIADTIETVMGWFGKKDIPWVKSLRESAASMEKSLEEQAANRAKLDADSNATLKSIGKKVQAEQELAKKSTEASKKMALATGKVVMGIEDLASSAMRTVSEAEQLAAARKSGVSASPATQTGLNVTTPEVNKTEVAQKEKATTEQSGPVVVSAPDVVALLRQQVELNQQLIAFFREQATTDKKGVAALASPRLADTTLLMPRALGVVA